MAHIFYLADCTTCQRILKELKPGPGVGMQDIKTESITPEQIDEMKRLAGSYEALFSRRAMKFRAWGLHEKSLGEADYRQYILDEYTFLKRPVIVVNEQIFIGNTNPTVAAAKAALDRL